MVGIISAIVGGVGGLCAVMGILIAFDVAAELAVNHINVLASAIGLTHCRYNMLGLISCRTIGIDIQEMKREWNENKK